MVNITCTKCEYQWQYKGELDYACCPRCMRKIKLSQEYSKND